MSIFGEFIKEALQRWKDDDFHETFLLLYGDRNDDFTAHWKKGAHLITDLFLTNEFQSVEEFDNLMKMWKFKETEMYRSRYNDTSYYGANFVSDKLTTLRNIYHRGYE